MNNPYKVSTSILSEIDKAKIADTLHSVTLQGNRRIRFLLWMIKQFMQIIDKTINQMVQKRLFGVEKGKEKK